MGFRGVADSLPRSEWRRGFSDRMSNITEQEEQERALSHRFQSIYGTSQRRSSVGRAVKRASDIVGATAGLIVLAIPFLLAAIAIKLDSRGPVFFVRERVGCCGKLFPLVKFRTMEDGALSRGAGYTVSHDDPRITRVGRLLRIWSIDELPQLFNVLRGEMSLVGPRPSWPHEVLAFDDAQLGKVRVVPGITGLAAISGRNQLPWEKRIELDNWYIDHWSNWLDFKIVIQTPFKVLAREGIYGSTGVNPSIAPHPIPPGAHAPREEEVSHRRTG